MRSIRQISSLKGKTALVRVDFNVPLNRDGVEDNFRILKSLPTIKLLQRKGAKIVLMSHLGKGGETLEPVAKELNKFIKAKFISTINDEEVRGAVRSMRRGEVILIENLRNDEGEKNCNKLFASKLAKMGDIYVNEAFSVSHRKDASIVLLPKLLPSYAGIQLQEEIKNLSHAFKNPKRPFLFILGGSKFSTKMPLIKKYLKLADYVFIGGALLNDFLRAKGYEIGMSLASDISFGIDRILKNKKLILPSDVVVGSGTKLENKSADGIEKQESVLDIGEKSVEDISKIIKEARLILWNGPLGKYEAGGAASTKKILKVIAASKAESIIGGGDTVALVSEMKMEKKLSFVSTGGGATLDFLASGTLPGIKALG